MKDLAKSFELELRGRLRRSEDAQAALAEAVDHTGGQWCLRADDGQLDPFLDGVVGELLEVGDRDVLQPLVARRAAVAGRDVDRLHPRRLRQPP